MKKFAVRLCDSDMLKTKCKNMLRRISLIGRKIVSLHHQTSACLVVAS